jgi:hypothetical protein
MKNPHPRDVPVVRDLSPNLMGEIGRIIFSHAYVEWRLNLIIYDFLHVTKVLGRLVGPYTRGRCVAFGAHFGGALGAAADRSSFCPRANKSLGKKATAVPTLKERLA